MMKDLKVVGGTRFGRDSKISLENTFNMYVSDGALIPYSGYKFAKELPGENARAIYVNDKLNTMLIVVDDSVFKFNSSLGYSKVGDLQTSVGPVFIASNEADQFAISDLHKIYLYTHGGSISTPTLPTATFLPGYMDYQDGYFICPDRNSNQWNLSHLNDGTNWTQIDADGAAYFDTFGTKTDTCMACVAFNRLLFVMAKTGTEIWRDVGNLQFPYQRDNSVAIDYGCVSLESIAEGFGYLVWLASNEYSNPTIMVSTGGKPISIINDGIDYLLETLNYPESSSGFIYQEGSHVFYQITFYKDNYSLVYDFIEKKFYTLTDGSYNYHDARKLIYFRRTPYFIPFRNNDGTSVNLYKFGAQYTTYNGKTIPRTRVCPPVRKADSSRFKMPKAIITMQQGVTKLPARVEIAMSIDGGYSFGNTYGQDTNAYGYAANKMVFRQLGSANDVTFKFTFWSGDDDNDPIELENGALNEKFAIINGQLEVR